MSSIEVAKKVVFTEIAGLDYMISRIDSEFDKAIKSIITTSGRVIILGMGKSGIIGRKISATLASTGTPSFFIHPSEAFHGDLGMVMSDDILIAISNSGETDELLKLLPFCLDNGNVIIAITGNKDSTLAINAHCHLDIGVPSEACPLQLAPTSSTTATLVMGDALAIALMEKRNFKPENFARFHPGGRLGKRLLSKVRDEMVSNNLPIVKLDSSFSYIINTISSYQLGLTLVNTDDCEFMGIITDGDIRRAMDANGKNSFDLKAVDIFSNKPITVNPDTSIQQAYEIMDDKSITSLVVVENNKVTGIIKK